MSRELSLLLNQLKGKDATLIRKDMSALTQTISKEGAVFLKSRESSKKEQKWNGDTDRDLFVKKIPP